MNNFYKLLERKKCLEPSMKLFTLNQQDDNNTQTTQEEINMLQDLTQKCTTIYLQEMLLGTFTSSTNLTINGTSLIPYPIKYLPVSNDLGKIILDDLFKSIILDTLNDEKIQTFIGTIIQCIATQKQQEFSIEDFEMNGNFYQELQTLFIGCTEHCPLCRQQCDLDHQNDPVSQRTHDCSKGHQLQCFGGNKDLNNNASVKSCSELKDSTLVKINGKQEYWGKLKNEGEFKHWEFSNQSSEKVDIIIDKYGAIWNKFGKLFCEIFNDRQQVQMTFVQYEKMKNKEIHYLLLLDKSGSMYGQPWNNLKNQVNSFLVDLMRDPLKHKHSKVSVILYDSKATVQDIFVESSTNIINKLSTIEIDKWSNTSFQKLFGQTYEYLTENLSKADQHIVCLMTNGDDAYPETQINKFLQNKQLMDKILFQSILYSEKSSTVLEKIATTLQGTIKTALTSQQLEDSFQELISSVYA
eukprot:403367141